MKKGAGCEGRPGCRLFRFFGRDAESDASVQRDGFKLDVETVAVGMCPCAADANPVVVAAFAIANIVGEVAGGFGWPRLPRSRSSRLQRGPRPKRRRRWSLGPLEQIGHFSG